MNDKCVKSEACMLVLITKRDNAEKFSGILASHGVKLGVVTYGSGTAPTKMLDILGIGHTEYDVTVTVLPSEYAPKLMSSLHSELKEGGSGIAFTVPTDTYIGNKARKKIGLDLKEDNTVSENAVREGHSLIVIITNSGYSEEVMDVARGAGATGGTVIHARGTGLKNAKTFFGITIQPEKDLILIVAPADNVEAITSAVDSDTSLRQEAHPVSFSLPVNGLAGFKEGFYEE